MKVNHMNALQDAEELSFLGEESPEQSAWIADQSKQFKQFRQENRWEALDALLRKQYPAQMRSCYAAVADKYFYRQWSSAESGYRYFVQKRSAQHGRKILGGEGESEGEGSDGEFTYASVSPTGKHFLYSGREGHGDWQEWRFANVEGESLPAPEVLRFIKGVWTSAAAWTAEGTGLYYSRFDEPEQIISARAASTHHMVYFHKLGTRQADDLLVCQSDTDWLEPAVSEDGKHLVVHAESNSQQAVSVLYQHLPSPKGEPLKRLDLPHGRYKFVGAKGQDLWLLSYADAPAGKIIVVTVTASGDIIKVKEVVPQTEDCITDVCAVDNKFIVTYMHLAHSVITVYDRQGKFLSKVALPEPGTVKYMSAAGANSRRVIFSYGSFSRPETFYELNLRSACIKSLERAEKSKGRPGDQMQFKTEQIFCTSADGTQVPIFVSYRLDLKPDPSTPCCLYGYGAWGTAQTPEHDPLARAWMHLGGIHAVVNARGGGEFGEQWHLAATKLNKQRSFDDFIAAAAHLISCRLTSAERMVFDGGSFGGLLVGAVVTQRPDLCRAAVMRCALLDMLSFESFPVGAGWVREFGSTANEDELAAMLKYSPLQNIRSGDYPACLLLTGTKDDRVSPTNSYMFVEKLRRLSPQTLVLLKPYIDRGHTLPWISLVDKLGFFSTVLNLPVPGTEQESQP